MADSTGAIVAGWGTEATRTNTYESVDSMNGLISYLAIYIGFVLVLACARFLRFSSSQAWPDASPSSRILSELGCPTRTICHQRWYSRPFSSLPAGDGHRSLDGGAQRDHSLGGALGGFDIAGTVAFTALIFVVAYGGYFAVTYLMSKGIVHDAVRIRHAV